MKNISALKNNLATYPSIKGTMKFVHDAIEWKRAIEPELRASDTEYLRIGLLADKSFQEIHIPLPDSKLDIFRTAFLRGYQARTREMLGEDGGG